MITDVTGFIAGGWAVDGVSLPGGLVHATDRWPVEHCLGPPGLGTWIVKSKRHRPSCPAGVSGRALCPQLHR